MNIYSISQKEYEWNMYQEKFIQYDGRVIDYYQGHSSHSEGQGYALTLSVIFNDKNLFKIIWKWTKDNLFISDNNLFAWHWGKNKNGEWKILDKNNATDGDILIANALLKAYKKWDIPEYKIYAIKVIKTIRENLHISSNGYDFILPGLIGFKKNNGYIINNSYSIFPAYKNFAENDSSTFWNKIYNDSIRIIKKSMFGKYKLPVSWMLLNTEGEFKLSKRKSKHFGLSEIRIFLHILLDENLNKELKLNPESLFKYFNHYGRLPMEINIINDEPSEINARSGQYAIYSLLAKHYKYEDLSDRFDVIAREKLFDEGRNYYSYSLYMLSKYYEDFWSY